MKRLFSILTLLFCIVISSIGQNYQEVVYLKNGSIIRGVVIEQIPNQSIKIKTTDGNIFAYNTSEVEKIMKEEVNLSSLKNTISSGYKGFIDLGYTIGIGDFEEDRIEFTTSHGYQANPYLFIGAGVGVSYWFGPATVAIPIFGNLRLNIPTGAPVCPYFDFKLGYSPYDLCGFYGNFSAGCRIATGSKSALNIGFGYQIQKVDELFGKHKYSVNVNGLAFKVGYEF